MTIGTLDFRTPPSAPAAPQAEVGERESVFQRICRWSFRVAIGFLLLSVVSTLIYAFVPVPATPLMFIRVVENLVEGKKVHFEKDWVSIEEMSPKLQYAVIAAEDMRFFEHHGFDFEAIEKAMKHNSLKRNEKRNRVRGGSTISQQVAKNVFLWPQRSWLRKLAEVYFTGLIEIFWSKKRIMEVYLNVVELGDGVYGVEAASRKFFHKPARNLNSSEAALVAAVLPNPRRFLIQKPSGYIRLRQSLIQRRMPSAAQTIPRG